MPLGRAQGDTADDAMTGTVDGKEITAREEPFSVVNEAWNEYVLESGVRVRVKPSVAKLGTLIDERGNSAENRDGAPVVLVQYGLEVVTGMDSEEGQDAPLPCGSTPQRSKASLYSHRLRSAISGDSASERVVPDKSAQTESESINTRAHRFESSESIHPSQDLARADRIVNRLPQEMASRYELRKPMVIELERTSKESVIASFFESDSHMSGYTPSDAINELLVWMGEEYDDLDRADPDELSYPSIRKRAVLREYLKRVGYESP